MFDNIHHFPQSTAELTTALVDGAEVRYVVSFCATLNNGLSSVACAVVHPGESTSVALSVCEHR